MRDAIVEPGAPTVLPTGYGAWLTAALREQERRGVSSRGRLSGGSADGVLAEPRIDRAACAEWLAAAPARDRREGGR